jgi:hypothetical protein
MTNWTEPDKKRKSLKEDQQSLRGRVKKRQIVIKVPMLGKHQSFTRYEEDGMIRSIHCPHGTTCKNFGSKDVTSCFVKTEERS